MPLVRTDIEARTNPRHLGQVSRSAAHKFVQFTSGLAGVLLALSVWGQWNKVAWLVGIEAFRFLANVVLVYWTVHVAKRQKSYPLLQLLQPLFNVALSIYSCHIADWTAPAILYAPFQVVVLDVYVPVTASLAWTCITLGTAAVLAFLDGAGAVAALSILTISAGITGLARLRSLTLLDLLKQVAGSNDEIEKMQSALIQQEKLSSLGVLAAGIAHEINNPMGYITANVRCLLTELKALPSLPTPLRDYVEDVLPDTLDGIARVNAIVGDLRRFARGEPDGFVAYDLNSEVSSAVRICGTAVSARAEVVCRLEPGLPALLGRPQQIGQVLVNLLMNAAQAMPAPGRIEVETRRRGDELLISVQDTGSGMSDEVLQQLFQPFFTTKAAGEGTGLGLSVAWGIVKSHGGEISVQSQVGAGTCFTITLPLIPPLQQQGSVRPNMSLLPFAATAGSH